MYRLRRNRKSVAIRQLVQESSLSIKQIIFPLFLLDKTNAKEEIASMPHIYRYSIDRAIKEIDTCLSYGIASFALFPVIEESKKDKFATISYGNNVLIKAIKEIKKVFPDVCLITDVAMDPYSSEGHDGIYFKNEILNDPTLEILGRMALAQASAGADIVAPSDMMDGRVGYIRKLLDKEGFKNVSIMSYTAKYASSFYSPFRDALHSYPKKGDKKTYQMDFRNKKEAILEAYWDVKESADFLLVKPALPYLDIIHILKEKYLTPIVAYHVSGEYAMLWAAIEKGWLDYEESITEVLSSIKRAGADNIITYFAKDIARLLKK